MKVDLYEKIWMWGVAAMLSLFFISTAVAAVKDSIHPPSHVETIDPKTVLADARFRIRDSALGHPVNDAIRKPGIQAVLEDDALKRCFEPRRRA